MSDEISPRKRKHKGGMPPFVPTPEQRLMVQILVSNGTPQDVIARNIHRQKGDRGIDEKTLRKCFREELDCGYSDTVARMGGTVVREGLKGNIAAAKYWLTTHAGDEWKTTENVRHGLTPEAQASGASLVAPVLVVQPVRAITVTEQKPNGHAEGPINGNGHIREDAPGPDA
jgi:hypothetical protein